MTNPQKPSAEDQELVALFAGLDTPGVSDALDKLGIHGQAPGIAPLADYPHPIVGPALTVKYVPASVPPGTVGDFIDDAAEGDVIVIDNGCVEATLSDGQARADKEAKIMQQLANGRTTLDLPGLSKWRQV